MYQAPLGRADRGVEAERRRVRPERRRRVVDARARVGLDLRVRGGEAGLHDRRLLDREALHPAVRRGQRDDGVRRADDRAAARPHLRAVARSACRPAPSSVNAL